MQANIRSRLVTLSFATFLASCGGGGGTQATDDPGGPPPADTALRAAAPGELADYFRARVTQRLTQGLSGIPARDTVPAPTTAAGPGAVTAGGTPQQEPGVEEDDLLKTDGTHVFAVHAAYPTGTGTAAPARLAVSRIQADGLLGEARSVTLDPAFTPTGMYHLPAAQRVAVVAQRASYGDIQPATSALLPLPPNEIALDLFDVSGSTPSQRHRISIDGRLVATRMIGSVLYVASAWQPDLSRYELPAGTPVAQAQQRLAALSAAQLLPVIRVDGAAQPLVDESDCLLQPANASLALQLTTITAIDLASPGLERRSRCFVGDATGLYMSPTSVYVASSRQVWIAAITPAAVLPRVVTTDIHKFALQGLDVAYRGSGEVEGTLGWEAEKMPYRMSEHDGHLRVLSTTGMTGGSPATLTVLRENGAQRRLDVVATLPNARRPAHLGRPGEQVHGVHFTGATAYLVTFRRVDPLYVLDLSDPADPKAVGELTVPGYSDYLFPLGNGKLLGVGKDASDQGVAQGVKVALFDMADPAQPRMLASVTLGERLSASALDYTRHGISLLGDGPQVRVALPVRTATSGTASTTYEQALARFTVDTAAGTLAQRPRVLAMRFDSANRDWTALMQYDLGRDRVVQTANASYYMTGGRVIATREP